MRIIFGAISLLIVMVIVLVLAKKQFSPMSFAPVHLQNSTLVDQTAVAPLTLPGATPQIQSRQIEQQIKQSVEAALQQRGALTDDAK